MMMNRLVEEGIRFDMATKQPGERARTVCPFCAAEHERSFEVTRSTDRPHMLWFRCYRGSCARSGYVVDRSGAGMVLQAATTEPPKVKELREHSMPSEKWLSVIAIRYHIPAVYMLRQGVRHSEAGDALCMPWRNQEGQQIGWVEKRYAPDAYKSHHDLAYRDPQGGRLSFPRIGRSYHAIPSGTPCVLVEGLLDAYRINSHAEFVGADVCAVALLGADLSLGDASLISRLFEHVMVCLDPDQWPKGHMRVTNRFGATMCNAQATTLHQDPKDSDDEALEDLIERCREMP